MAAAKKRVLWVVARVLWSGAIPEASGMLLDLRACVPGRISDNERPVRLRHSGGAVK